MDELISQFLCELAKNKKGSFKSGNKTVEYDVTDNSYMVRVTEDNKKNTYVSEFRRQLDSLDDDIFVDACDLYEKTSEGGVCELSRLCDTEQDFGCVRNGINEFKSCVNAVIAKRINELRETINDLDNMRM